VSFTELSWKKYIIVLIGMGFSVLNTAWIAFAFWINNFPMPLEPCLVTRTAEAVMSTVAVFVIILGYWILIKALATKGKAEE